MPGTIAQSNVLAMAAITPNKTKNFLLFALLIPCWIIASHYNVDLVNLYAAAQYTHSDLTRIYAQNGNLGRYFYGPFSLILIKPLALYPFEVVKWFWILLQTISYGVFWVFLYRLYPFLKDNKIFWGWLLIWIVAINPIHNNYQSNNIQLMLAALVVVAEVWSRTTSKTKQFLAGALVVLAAMIKVFPLFLVGYYFFFKPAQVRKGLLLSSAVMMAAPLLFFGNTAGMQLYKDFFLNLGTYSVENNFLKVPDILCLPSLLARFGIAPNLIQMSVVLISIIFFIWVGLRQKDLVQPRLNLHYTALAWALCVFLNPSSRPHYFIFYLPAFCSLMEIVYRRTKSAELVIGAIVSTFLIAFTAEGITGKRLNDTFEFKSVPTYGMIILCLILIYAIRHSANQRT